MFNKEGIPFFTITIPFLCIVFLAFFSTSYYLKTTQESFESDLILFEKYNMQNSDTTLEKYSLMIKEKKDILEKKNDEFINFIFILSISIIFFMALFSFLMTSIISDIIKKYKNKSKIKKKNLKLSIKL